MSRFINPQWLQKLKQPLKTALYLIFLILLAWLSHQYTIQTDITQNSRNSLSDTTIKLLASLTHPVNITVYMDENKSQREKIKRLIQRYIYLKQNISLRFINPQNNPEKMRKLGIDNQGTISISYQGRTENIKVLDESELSNTLYRLSHKQDQWITFINGHGERSPSGEANFDWGLFGNELKTRSANIVSINLAQIQAIPENSSLLVIASPSNEYLDGEIEIILDYIESGGNLLWVTEPSNANLLALAMQLGIEILPGTIVATNSQIYGIDNPTFVIVKDYLPHTITKNMQAMTVFPVVSALNVEPDSDFIVTPLLNSIKKSWTETGLVAGAIRFDLQDGDIGGPLTFAYALQRHMPSGRQQRIVVLGDGDFLSNSYLGNVGNQNFGFRIINWLNQNDNLINIPTKNTYDREIHLTHTQVAVIGLGFLIGLPVLLIVFGILIWRKRKQQ